MRDERTGKAVQGARSALVARGDGGLGEQADHAWQALTLVALAFAPAGEPFTWQREREIVGSE